MKKGFFYAAAVATALAVLPTACSEEESGSGGEVVAVTGVALSQNTAALSLADSLALTATVQPENATNTAVSWTSSNTAVVKVSNGLLTPVAKGAATITVATADGNQTDTCFVTVSVLGKVSFASTQTWKVGDQEWSDAVEATGCKKEAYDGGLPEPRADCRSNPNKKGDLFSWKAVSDYKDELCPDGWRVPDSTDFKTLDIALGGSGEQRYAASYISFINSKYLSTWGASSYSGMCDETGELSGQRSSLDGNGSANYWSLSERDGVEGMSMNIGTIDAKGYIYPQNNYHKFYGLTLRCVR